MGQTNLYPGLAMKQIRICLILALLWLIPVFTAQANEDQGAATGQPCLVVPVEGEPLGPVIEGPAVPYRMRLRNTGNAPLDLLTLIPGKGTRVVHFPKTISPGKEAFIDLELKTLGMPGKTPRGVRLRCNDPDQPVRYLPLVLVVTPQISITPDRFSLNGSAGSLLEGTLVLKGNLNQPLELKILETQLNDKDTICLEKMLSSYALHLKSSPAGPGIQRGRIVLSSNYPQSPRLIIPVMIRALAPLQALPEIILFEPQSPEPGDHQAASLQAPVLLKAHCLVRSNDGQDFAIRNIRFKPDIKGILTRISPVKAGQLYRISISMPEASKDNILPPVMEIHTDHPGCPVIETSLCIKK